MTDIIGWTISGFITKWYKTSELIFGDIVSIEKDERRFWKVIYKINTKNRETGEVSSIRLRDDRYEQLCHDWLIGKWNIRLGLVWELSVTNRYYEHRDINARKKAERLEQERLEKEGMQ